MKQEFVTLPREVVEHVLKAMGRGGLLRQRQAMAAIHAALEQPQRKLTPQDISDSALLGNIESPFNSCMHQEHCKRWKAQADQQHQGELSSDNDLQCENSHFITTSSSVPFGYKLVPVEPTQEMLDAYIHMQGRFSSARSDWAAMLAAAPQPPVVGQSDNDTVPVPRSLLGAACAAISRKQDAPKVLEQLRRYTTGDLSQPAAEQPQVEQKPVAEVIESHVRAGLDGRFTAVVAGRERLSVGAEIFVHPQPNREPLSLAQIAEVFGWKPGYLPTPEQVHDARAIEAAHNIK